MSAHDDLLERATAAARELCDDARSPGRVTRDIVLARALERRRGARRAAIAMPLLAATLVCSTAWAATTGRLAPAATWWRTHVVERSAPIARTPLRPVAPRVAPPPVAPLAPELPPPVVVAPAPVTPSAAPQRTLARAASARPDPADALYAAAHAAHFAAQDPAAALAAWDAYLRAAPHGRFAPEARYNRALDLIHLGRDDEAREALRPIAAGSEASYRRTEAQRLLEALGER